MSRTGFRQRDPQLIEQTKDDKRDNKPKHAPETTQDDGGTTGSNPAPNEGKDSAKRESNPRR